MEAPSALRLGALLSALALACVLWLQTKQITAASEQSIVSTPSGYAVHAKVALLVVDREEAARGEAPQEHPLPLNF